jgi:hypothetical protein
MGNYWEAGYRPPGLRANQTAARLAWGFAPPEFFAGVYFDCSTGSIRPKPDADWRIALEAAYHDVPNDRRWGVDDGDRKRLWLGRTRSLTELVRAHAGAKPQADAVASFVENALSELMETRRGMAVIP